MNNVRFQGHFPNARVSSFYEKEINPALLETLPDKFLVITAAETEQALTVIAQHGIRINGFKRILKLNVGIGSRRPE